MSEQSHSPLGTVARLKGRLEQQRAVEENAQFLGLRAAGNWRSRSFISSASAWRKAGAVERVYGLGEGAGHVGMVMYRVDGRTADQPAAVFAVCGGEATFRLSAERWRTHPYGSACPPAGWGELRWPGRRRRPELGPQSASAVSTIRRCRKVGKSGRSSVARGQDGQGLGLCIPCGHAGTCVKIPIAMSGCVIAGGEARAPSTRQGLRPLCPGFTQHRTHMVRPS